MNISEFIYTVLLGPRPLKRITNAFIRSILPKAIKIGGVKVALNPSDPVVSGALTLGVYEKDEIRFFQKHYKPGMTFIDVGANVGLYTGLALFNGKNQGRILSIEPHEESRRFLEKTIRYNSPGKEPFGNVVVVPMAVGSMPGRGILYSNTENKGDNRIYSHNLLSTSTRIEMTTIDELCLTHGIETVDFMKIDVQGAELQVLQGSTSLLSHSPKCLLMTEFWAYGLRQAGNDPKSYLDLIKSLGFTLLELRKNRLKPIQENRLIIETSDRAYRNLVGVKGYTNIIQNVSL